MVETKTIILNEQEIIYKIHYKRIKNCYLRVEKGEVVIRCSPMFPQSEIEKLIRKKKFLNKSQDIFLNITIKMGDMFIYLIKNMKLS